MKYTEIPVLPTKHIASSQSRKVREEAPAYLRAVIEKTRAVPFASSLADLGEDDLTPLGGGKDAATYLLLHHGKAVIIKFGYQGLAAEAEALQAWAAKGVHVPAVYGQGAVPGTDRGKQPVYYLVEEALVDTHGRLAETCEAFLHHSPKQARQIGDLMGRELTKVHRSISNRSFGDYADSNGNTAAYGSWNKYLLDYFATQEKYLQERGVAQYKIQAVRDFIAKCTFVKRGRYIHGDFSIRNAAIQPHKDRVLLFDPNPVIGDPSWDVAILYNNRDFSKQHTTYDDSQHEIFNRNQQLLIGFRQGYGRNISLPNLVTAQLVQGILHAQYHETKVAKHNGDRKALRARREVVLGLVERICRGDIDGSD